MGKKPGIFVIVVMSVLGLVYVAFLFLLPALVNPDSYSRVIKKAVNKACGLEIEPGMLKLHTYPDLSAGITAEGTEVLIPGNTKPVLKLKKAGVKVRLFPLLFKRLEFAEIYVNNLEISLIKLEGGKYDIENAIKLPEKPIREDEIAAQEKESSGIKPVFDCIDIIVRDYKINLTDKSGANSGVREQSAVLKGDIIKISDFQPGKFIKVATKGQFLVGQEPRIMYDVVFSDEISPELDEGLEEKLPEENPAFSNIDPLEGVLKYNLKANIKANLKVKNGKKFRESAYIKGFLDINKLSFNIDGKALPNSYGKFKFSGKKLDIDSKLFITPAVFIAIPSGTLKFGENKAVFENTSGYLGDTRFDIVGDISSKLIADVKILAPAVNCGTLFGIVNNSKFFADFKPQFKDINSVSGYANAEIHIKGDLNKEILPQIKLSTDNIRAYYVPSKLPITIISGSITTDTKNTKLKNLSLKLSDSPVKIKGEINDNKGTQNVNITASGKILNADIAKYLPFEAEITGKPEDLKVIAQININKLTPGIRIKRLKGTSNVVSINANVKPDVIFVSNSGLFAVENALKVKGKYDLTSAHRLIALEGKITGYSTRNPALNNIKVDISGLDIALLEPKGSLQINGNLVLGGSTGTPKVLGTVSLRNIRIPSMKLHKKTVEKTVDLTMKNFAVKSPNELIVRYIKENAF